MLRRVASKNVQSRAEPRIWEQYTLLNPIASVDSANALRLLYIAEGMSLIKVGWNRGAQRARYFCVDQALRLFDQQSSSTQRLRLRASVPERHCVYSASMASMHGITLLRCSLTAANAFELLHNGEILCLVHNACFVNVTTRVDHNVSSEAIPQQT